VGDSLTAIVGTSVVATEAGLDGAGVSSAIADTSDCDE